MIIIKLKGGLGNQMFQYAAGRAAAFRANTTLAMDTEGYYKKSHLMSDTPRPVSIDHFNIEATLADAVSLKKKNTIIRKIIKKISLRLISDYAYKGEVFHPKPDSYLDGYYQGEIYFKEYSDIIRKELKLKDPLGNGAEAIKNKIEDAKKSGAAISVHIRRGDYAKNPAYLALFGVCPPEYYQKAMDHMSENITSAIHYFVFSDDMEWVKANIKFPENAFYVSDSSIKDYEELVLMSFCDNHIIANSTFSWWGAWLDPNPNKIIVAPTPWVAKKGLDTPLIYPEGWHLIQI